MNRLVPGQPWVLCTRHSWTGWRQQHEPCAGCVADPPPAPPGGARIVAMDHAAGVITLGDA